MRRVHVPSVRARGDRGVSLFVVAAGLFVFLGVAALCIDLVVLYLARSEAQRTADAAALAGAKAFVDSGFLSGSATQAQAEEEARQHAKSVAAANTIAGDSVLVEDSDVTFDFSRVDNPRISVAVQRIASRSNAIPTLFGKALGIFEADIGATATAEAYTSSGGGPPIGTGCVKPWILPNCDPNHTNPTNPLCPGSVAYYVNEDGTISNPGPASDGGVIGQSVLLKPGSPGDAPAPSQFYPIQIPPGDDPAICPSCAQTTGSSGPGAALYSRNIACCNTNILTCGQVLTLDRQTGNMVGPTSQGVQCLIHQQTNSCNTDPSGCGQDYINAVNQSRPIIGGLNNPNPILRGEVITSSDSLVTVPLYAGENPCPGGSSDCSTVQIVGFLQMFIEKVGAPQATVTGRILQVAGCGLGGSGGGTEGGGGSEGGDSGSSGSLTGPGGSLIPIRLVKSGG